MSSHDSTAGLPPEVIAYIRELERTIRQYIEINNAQPRRFRLGEDC